MGETKILWAGRPLPDGTIEPGYSFNPWIGCQKVSAGCQNCYAEKLAHFRGWVNEWGKDYKLTSDSNWKNPIKWAKQAVKSGVVRRVFCASLADVFDDNIPNIWWRQNLWDLIDKTGKIGGLEWLLLTKRPETIDRFIPWIWRQEPPDNVRIGVTCENQEMFDKRAPILLDQWKGKNFISYEPALSLLHLGSYGYKIDWLIAGCESGTNARGANTQWFRIIRDQCNAFDIPFFLKQMMIPKGGIDEPYKGLELEKEPCLDGRQWLEFPK
jgi:protein gp37